MLARQTIIMNINVFIAFLLNSARPSNARRTSETVRSHCILYRSFLDIL